MRTRVWLDADIIIIVDGSRRPDLRSEIHADNAEDERTKNQGHIAVVVSDDRCLDDGPNRQDTANTPQHSLQKNHTLSGLLHGSIGWPQWFLQFHSYFCKLPKE